MTALPTDLLTISPTRGGLRTVEPRPHVEDECRAGGAASAPDSSGEVGTPAHPMGRGQHRSGSETGAALTAPRRQDRAAGAGAHPEPEAVGLGPTTVVGLERTLGHEELRGLARRAGRGRPPLGRTCCRRAGVLVRRAGAVRLRASALRYNARPGGRSNRDRPAHDQLSIIASIGRGWGRHAGPCSLRWLLVVDNRWTPPLSPVASARALGHRPPAVQSRRR